MIREGKFANWAVRMNLELSRREKQEQDCTVESIFSAMKYNHVFTVQGYCLKWAWLNDAMVVNGYESSLNMAKYKE